MTPQLDASLTAAHADVKAEIARSDGKASLLLAFCGALLAGGLTVATSLHLPLAAGVCGAVGMLMVATAAAQLLRTVRPNLSGRVGMPKWATLTAEEIRTELAQDKRDQHIRVLAHIAVAKYRHLKRAIDLICLAGGAFTVAAVLLIGGAA